MPSVAALRVETKQTLSVVASLHRPAAVKLKYPTADMIVPRGKPRIDLTKQPNLK